MTCSLPIQRVIPRPIAAVRERMALCDVPSRFAPLLDQVSSTAKGGAIGLDGQNVFVYRAAPQVLSPSIPLPERCGSEKGAPLYGSEVRFRECDNHTGVSDVSIWWGRRSGHDRSTAGVVYSGTGDYRCRCFNRTLATPQGAGAGRLAHIRLFVVNAGIRNRRKNATNPCASPSS